MTAQSPLPGFEFQLRPHHLHLRGRLCSLATVSLPGLCFTTIRWTAWQPYASEVIVVVGTHEVAGDPSSTLPGTLLIGLGLKPTGHITCIPEMFLLFLRQHCCLCPLAMHTCIAVLALLADFVFPWKN
uniref:Uncharacterized protein n=1 Tax=Molossus molossus TaxID=27622 RepID=A0A7J8DPX9_MOLMO|nr:hypothetical protein HJG59_009218 [Molossus molossus]